MKLYYDTVNITFYMEQYRISSLHFVYEQFLRSIPCHSHSDNSYEIHYISHGKGNVKISGVLYPIVPNTLYITGPHVEHEQIPDAQDPMFEYCIYLKTEKLSKRKQQKKADNYMQLFLETAFWFGQDSQNIHSLMQQIFYELEKKYDGYHKLVETLLQQLIIKMTRNYVCIPINQEKTIPFDLGYGKFLIIEEYFLYEYKKLSLNILSERLGLGPRQTERLLKKHYGKSFLQKKTEARMSAALILLLDPNKRITDIALDIGYSSSEHFSNAFKRYFGMTAREYRKKC